MDGVDKGGTLQIASTECHYARICYLRKKNGKTKAGTDYTMNTRKCTYFEVIYSISVTHSAANFRICNFT